MNGWMYGRDGRIDGWMDRRMHGWMDGCMDGWKDGWMDGWMDGWIDGSMDGWMEAKFRFNEILQERKFAHAKFREHESLHYRFATFDRLDCRDCPSQLYLRQIS